MAQQWFKFYGGEYLSDPKIGSLTPQERSCWVTLMCLASTSTKEGIVEFLTVEVLLQKSGIQFDPYHPEEWDKCLSILSKFERMSMIKTNDAGNIEMLNWSKRQETFMTQAERAKAYRERKKSDENVTAHVTNVTLEKSRVEKNREDTIKGFTSFWEIYPPTRKQDKAKCIKKWGALILEEPELEKIILADIEKRSTQHTDWVKENGKYVPAPLVYLNNRRWEAPIIGATGGNKTYKVT